MLDGSSSNVDTSTAHNLHLHAPTTAQNGTSSSPPPTQPSNPSPTDDANKYRPFRLIETEILSNLRSLIFSTTEEDLNTTTTTMMAGALTLALAYINKQTQEYNEFHGGGGGDRGGNDGREPERRTMLQNRILVLSVSGDLAFQYIPIMNCIFAAQRSVKPPPRPFPSSPSPPN